MSTSQSDTRGKADEVQKLHLAGLPVRAIAKALDLSTQGVYWHLKRLREAGKLEKVS